MQLERGREGRQAQARGRGVLEVGAGVGEEDEGHVGLLCTRGRRSRGVRGRRGGCESALPGDEDEMGSGLVSDASF